MLAIRQCADLKTKTQGGRFRRSPGERGEGPAVWWLSPAECEVDDLLEVCRNFFHYVAGHPEVGSSIDDPCLMAARELLQRLCPRINGLSVWSGAAAGVNAKTEVGGRPPTHARTRMECRKAKVPVRKPLAAAAAGRKIAAFLPTPPTQSGDVECAATIPTMRVERDGLGMVVPDAPGRDALPSPSASLKCRSPRDQARYVQGPRNSRTEERCRKGTFTLRPQHDMSPRCCSFQRE